MAKWEGFTEEDIKRVNACDRLTEVQSQPPSIVQEVKRQANLVVKKNVTRSKMLQKSRQLKEADSEATKMPKEAFLSKAQANDTEESKSNVVHPPSRAESSSDSGCGVSTSTDSPQNTSNVTTPNTSPSHGAVCLRIKEGKSYEVLSGNPASLDEFQARQKMMEEQNRRKKELLAKAIADRKKQTTAEARRLQQIQDELQKLDMLLSNDVSILRNEIEAASYEFMEAQKRYNKAEKEFLDAKLLLFDKLERKEMLTEHLCTIIEQNEIRKARKLSELMDKLDIGTISVALCEDEQKSVPKNVILSPLCALDEVSYAACSTLKPRNDVVKSDAKVSLEDGAENNSAKVDDSTREQTAQNDNSTELEKKIMEQPVVEQN